MIILSNSKPLDCSWMITPANQARNVLSNVEGLHYSLQFLDCKVMRRWVIILDEVLSTSGSLYECMSDDLVVYCKHYLDQTFKTCLLNFRRIKFLSF